MNGLKISKGEIEKPLVSVIVNHVSVDEVGKNLELYQNFASILFESGVNQFPEYEFAIINALEVKEVT
jgi:hypothetical protein